MSVKSTVFLRRDDAVSLLVKLAHEVIDQREDAEDLRLEEILQELDDYVCDGESYRNYMIVDAGDERLVK